MSKAIQKAITSKDPKHQPKINGKSSASGYNLLDIIKQGLKGDSKYDGLSQQEQKKFLYTLLYQGMYTLYHSGKNLKWSRNVKEVARSEKPLTSPEQKEDQNVKSKTTMKINDANDVLKSKNGGATIFLAAPQAINTERPTHPRESLLSGEHVVIIYCKKLKSLVHEMTLQYNC